MAKKLQDGLDIYPSLKKGNGTTRPEKITTKAQSAISRSEILDEIWSADKHTHNGKWYVSMSDVCAILGEDDAKQKR